MTLVELLLAYVVLGLLLVMVAGVSGYVQREAKRRLGEDMVITLREGVLAYRGDTGHFPSAAPDQSSVGAIAELLANAASSRLLADWPVSPPRGSDTIAQYVDPWGRSFRYVTSQNGSPLRREDVALNAGVPIFESAGPDGDFGDDRPANRGDNISSDIAALIAASEE